MSPTGLKGLLYAALALVTVALCAPPALAQTATNTTDIEAENMTRSGSAYPYPNATWASGGAMAYMTDPTGSLTDYRYYSGKLTKVEVSANSYMSSACGTSAPPQMRVSVDGTAYATADVSPGGLRWFGAALPSLPAGNHKVAVAYLSGPSCYDELQVDRVRLTDDGSGVTPPPPPSGSCDMSLGCQLMALPAYWDPSDTNYFARFAGASYPEGKGAAAMEIANFYNGAGSAYNSALDAAIKDAQSHGINVLGYVNTSAAPGTWDTSPRRPLADVLAEVDKWYQWYGVDGIFEDNAARGAVNVPFHKSVYDGVRANAGSTHAPDGAFDPSRHDYVVLNEAWSFDEGYMDTADIVVTFEDTYSVYTDGNTWENGIVGRSPFITSGKYPASRFWQIIEGASYEDLQNAVALSKQRNAGYVDIDNDVQGYADLPADPYWKDTNNALLQSRR